MLCVCVQRERPAEPPMVPRSAGVSSWWVVVRQNLDRAATGAVTYGSQMSGRAEGVPRQR